MTSKYTTICGMIAGCAGVVATSCASKYPTIAFWAGIVSACGVCIMGVLARDNKTSDEDVGADPFSRNIAAQTKPAPPPVPVEPKS